MQCMGYPKGPSAPSASELKSFGNIFDGNLTTSNIKALDMLFPDGGNGSFRQPRRYKARTLRWYWLFSIYVISEFEVFC
jgi:hypothetical protein